ncbi:hypothetical protein LPJ61_006073, partial [Coemansia biformis]
HEREAAGLPPAEPSEFDVSDYMSINPEMEPDRFPNPAVAGDYVSMVDRYTLPSEYQDSNVLPRSPSPPMPASTYSSYASKVHLRVDDDGSTVSGAGTLSPRGNEAAVAGKGRIVLILLRILHTVSGLLLAGCFGAMEAYMLVRQFEIVVIPLSVCRLILVTALIVILLCDWGFPRRIHRYFPMYSYRHSLMPFGLSHVSVAFFALSDPALAGMASSRSQSRFAQIAFPLILVCSSLVMLNGVASFIAGAIGGVGFRIRRRNR